MDGNVFFFCWAEGYGSGGEICVYKKEVVFSVATAAATFHS